MVSWVYDQQIVYSVNFTTWGVMIFKIHSLSALSGVQKSSPGPSAINQTLSGSTAEIILTEFIKGVWVSDNISLQRSFVHFF